MKAQLLGCTAPVNGKRFPFEEIARVGRDSQNEISIGAPSMARLHATISYSGGTFWVEDAGSPQGTFLNARRIAKERLYHLDVLGFGPDVELVFLARAPVETGPREGILAARLVAVDGPDAGSVREIPKGTFTVGRASVCNLAIDSGAVSKTHARLERTNSYVTVTDLGSANGTFVNGVRITTVPLSNGDHVLFAAAREFRVEIDSGTLSPTASSVDMSALREAPRTKQEEQIQELATSWKSRYDFTPGELAAGAAPVDAKATKEVGAPAKPAAPAKAAPAKAAAAAPPPAAKPQPPGEVAAKPAPPPAKPEPRAETPAAPAPPKSVVVAPPAPLPPTTPITKEAAPAPPAPPPTASAAAAAPAEALPPPETASSPATEIVGGAAKVAAVVLTGPTGPITLGIGRHIIGRGETSAIMLQSTKASRQHASIEVAPAGALLTDLGSANGTYVDGVRLTAPRPLAGGETVTFGDVPFQVSLTLDSRG